MADETCACGHPKSAHIYEEGACRPGWVCTDGCKEYRPEQADASTPVLYIEPGDRDGIPVDVFVTITALVSKAWPGALMTPGRSFGRGFGLALPDRAPKRVTKKDIAAERVEADPDADMGILGWDGQSLLTVLPEKLSRYLAEVVYSWLSSVEGAVNYVEQTMTHPDHPGEQLVMTAAWSKGQTPDQMRQKEKAERDRYVAVLREIRSWHGNSIDPDECMECDDDATNGGRPCRTAEAIDKLLGAPA